MQSPSIHRSNSSTPTSTGPAQQTPQGNTASIGLDFVAALLGHTTPAAANTPTGAPATDNAAAYLSNAQLVQLLSMIARTYAPGAQTPVPETQQHTATADAWIKRIIEVEGAALNKLDEGLETVKKLYDKAKRAERAYLKISELVEKGGVLKGTIPTIPKVHTTNEKVNDNAWKHLTEVAHDCSRNMTKIIRDAQLEAKNLAMAECEKSGSDLLDSATGSITKLAESREEFAQDAILRNRIEAAIKNVQAHGTLKYSQLQQEANEAYAKHAQDLKPLEDAWKQDTQATDIDMEPEAVNMTAIRAEVQSTIRAEVQSTLK